MATNENELDLLNEIYNFLISENEKWEQEQANRLAGSGAQYVSHNDLGEPVYESRRVSPNSKIIRERMSGMKVGEYAHFPEFAFPEGNGQGSKKDVTKTKRLFQNEFARIGKGFGLKVQVSFSRSRGRKLTPSVTIIGERGS